MWIFAYGDELEARTIPRSELNFGRYVNGDGAPEDWGLIEGDFEDPVKAYEPYAAEGLIEEE